MLVMSSQHDLVIFFSIFLTESHTLFPNYILSYASLFIFHLLALLFSVFINFLLFRCNYSLLHIFIDLQMLPSFSPLFEFLSARLSQLTNHYIMSIYFLSSCYGLLVPFNIVSPLSAHRLSKERLWNNRAGMTVWRQEKAMYCWFLWCCPRLKYILSLNLSM